MQPTTYWFAHLHPRMGIAPVGIAVKNIGSVPTWRNSPCFHYVHGTFPTSWVVTPVLPPPSKNWPS